MTVRRQPLVFLWLISALVQSAYAFTALSQHKGRSRLRTIACPAKKSPSNDALQRPKLIVLDLDGNLWRPEMYELAWDGNVHAPFKVWNNDATKLKSDKDAPDWAKELLDKFVLPKSKKTLAQVITGPWEIGYDSKMQHFERIAKKTGIPLEEMAFFDNEGGNCHSIAKMGVTVGFCPNGVKRNIWNGVMNAFPNTDGSVVGM